MKIGIYIDFGNKENLNLSSLQEGNPGLGGTEYQMISLPFFFAYHNRNDCTFNVYWTGKNSIIFNKKLNTYKVTSIKEAIQHAHNTCDLFVFNGATLSLIKSIDEENPKLQSPLKCIAWVHVFLPYLYKQALYESVSIKHVVCLSRQHFLQLSDHPLLGKLSFIYHGFDVLGYASEKAFVSDQQEENSVCFLGNIIPHKGFHLLAEIWKDILKELPSAQLKVIGNAQLYDNKTRLGKWGIAEESYELILRPYLSDSNGEKLESVTFLGLLGKEKSAIMEKASIGVVNPSGESETFCLSALEFQALRVPVVSHNFGGLKETIQHGTTGLLSYNKRQLTRHILYLLKNPKTRKQLGSNGRARVQDLFSYSRILAEWENLFIFILKDLSQKQIPQEKILLNKISNKINEIQYTVAQRVTF